MTDEVSPTPAAPPAGVEPMGRDGANGSPSSNPMSGASVPPGSGIVRTNVFTTLLYTVVAVPLALIDRRSLIVVVIVLSFVVFAAGIVAFLASFFIAAERSKTAEIGAANLYLLTGSTASRSIKFVMSGCLAVQVVVAFAVATIGLSSDAWANEKLNPMAFAALIPMFGLGLNGLWAAHHGSFGPRRLVAERGAPVRRQIDSQNKVQGKPQPKKPGAVPPKPRSKRGERR